MDLGEARRPHEMGFVGSYDFPLPPEQLWADVERFDRFEQWWGWLRGLRVEGSGLRDGTILRGVIVPPVPYRIAVHVELHGCRRPRRVDADVRGGLHGPARLRIHPSGSGSRVLIGWHFEMRQAAMRAAARVGYPLLRWGHDRVLDRAVAGYRRHLHEDHGLSR